MKFPDLRFWRKPEEQRVITGVPWDVGGQLPIKPVTTDQALSLVPVFGAVRLLASQISTLPLQTYRKVGDGRTKIPTGSLFTQPSAHGTTYAWLHRCVTSLALRGNAYGLVTARDSMGYPTMIEWLHPDHVQVEDQAMSGPGSYSQPIWYWMGRLIPTEDLVHIAWFTVPYRVKGLSPIEACASTISTGVSAQVYTADWFNNGAVPPGKMKNVQKTLSQPESDEIKARLTAAIRSRKPIVYGADWDYEPIAVAANEAKFIETMQLNATQIASIYGIPPEMLGGSTGSSLTYSTVEQNSINFVKFTLRPWLELLEETFSQLLPRPQYVKFNVDALLRGDLQTRMNAYQTARQIGLNNVDELRNIEDWAPLPNGEGKDYTPLLVQVAAARGIDAAQVKTGGPLADQPPQDQPQVQRSAEDDAGPKGWPSSAEGRRLSGAEAAVLLLARRRDPSDPAAMRNFNPNQPRRPDGEWGTGEAVHALKDALKLGDKADLKPGEKIIGSDKLNADSGTIRMALVDHNGTKSLRLGIGDETFGSRDDQTGPWRGGPDRTATINADRKKLTDEQASLEHELDAGHADPARKAAITKRLAEIDNLDTAEVLPAGYTANIDQQSAAHLRTVLADALTKGEQEAASRNAVYDEIERLTKEREPLRVMPTKWTPEQEAKWDTLTARIEQLQAEANKFDYATFAEGYVPGQWADVHYRVELDDPSIGVEVHLGAVPHGSTQTLDDLVGNQQGATLDPAEAQKFLKMLGQFAGPTQAARAAGHDTTPGHDELHHYWTKGAGLAKWVESPTPWTTLVAHLTKYVGPEKAKVYASRWFIEVFGFAAGSDKNRVTHGKPPRGKVVGPG